jgi:hypothetical protein
MTENPFWNSLYEKLWRVANKILSTVRSFLDVLKHYIMDLKRRHWRQIFPKKPRSLVFDTKKWNNEAQSELSREELSCLLGSPLFSEIQSITLVYYKVLHYELPWLSEVFFQMLPKLQNFTLEIGAAIDIKQEQVSALIATYAKHAVAFSLVVPLHGFRDTHDRKLGVIGDFDAAIVLLKHFGGNQDIDCSAKCAITKNNIWDLDELLEFCQREKIHIRYDLAAFPPVRSTDRQADRDGDFLVDETYQLALFLTKLELDYEKDDDTLRSYRNMRKLVSQEDKRRLTCPYQSAGVMVGGCGNLKYCGRSKIIGNGTYNPPLAIWKGNLRERRRIIRDECKFCALGYFGELSPFELVEKHRDRFWKKTLTFEEGVARAEKVLS